MAFLVPTTAVCSACKATSPAELTLGPLGQAGQASGLAGHFGDSVVPGPPPATGLVGATSWKFPAGEKSSPPPRPREAGLSTETVAEAELITEGATTTVGRRWHWVTVGQESLLVCSVPCARLLLDRERSLRAQVEAASRKRTDEENFGHLLPEIERIRCLADAALPPLQGDVIINMEPDWRTNGCWRGWAQTHNQAAKEDLTTFAGNDNSVSVRSRPSAWGAVAALIRRWDTAGRGLRLRRTPIPARVDEIVTALKDLALRHVGGRSGRDFEDEGGTRPGEHGFLFLSMIASRDSWAEIVDLVLPDASVTLREEVAFRVDTVYRNGTNFGEAAPLVMALRDRIAAGEVTAEQLAAATIEILQRCGHTRLYKAFCEVAIAAATPARELNELARYWVPKPVDRWHSLLQPDEHSRWRCEGICPNAPYALVEAAAADLAAQTDRLLFGTAYEAILHLRQVDCGDFATKLNAVVEAFWHGDDLALNAVPACLMIWERRFNGLAALLLPDAAAELRAEVAHALADGLTDSEEDRRLFGIETDAVEHLRQAVVAGVTPTQVAQQLLQLAEAVKKFHQRSASTFPAAFGMLARGAVTAFVVAALPQASNDFQQLVAAQLLATDKKEQ